MPTWLIVSATILLALDVGLSIRRLVESRIRVKHRDAGLARPRIAVEVPQAHYDLFRGWAEKNDQSLAEWVRKTLMDGVPRAERVRVLRASSSGEALNSAYAALDRADEGTGYLKGEETRPAPKKLPLIGHPCSYMNADDKPPHFAPGECSGICLHPLYKGRVCFWAPESAPGCAQFRHKNVLSKG